MSGANIGDVSWQAFNSMLEDGAIDSLIDQPSFGVAYVGSQRVVRWERQATRGRSDAQDCNCKSSGKHIPKHLPRAMRLRSRADRDRFPGILGLARSFGS